MEAIIRRAYVDDVARIKSLALMRRVSSKSDEHTGLIDYPVPSLDKYAFRVQNGLFYIAQERAEKEVIGFLDAYVENSLKYVFGEDPVVKKILKLGTSSFAYINTLAISKEHEGKHLPAKLFRTLKDDLQGNCDYIWSAIVHKPLMNQGSTKMAKRWGFRLEEEMDAFGKMTFGLYVLNLKKD